MRILLIIIFFCVVLPCSAYEFQINNQIFTYANIRLDLESLSLNEIEETVGGFYDNERNPGGHLYASKIDGGKLLTFVKQNEVTGIQIIFDDRTENKVIWAPIDGNELLEISTSIAYIDLLSILDDKDATYILDEAVPGKLVDIEMEIPWNMKMFLMYDISTQCIYRIHINVDTE